MAVLRSNQEIDTRTFDYIEDLGGSGTFRNDGASRFTIVDAPWVELRFDGADFAYGADSTRILARSRAYALVTMKTGLGLVDSRRFGTWMASTCA